VSTQYHAHSLFAPQKKEKNLDRPYFLCYYTFQVRVRKFSDSGSFSAAFLFWALQISTPYVRLINLEATCPLSETPGAK
jgi:hypothetical protein